MRVMTRFVLAESVGLALAGTLASQALGRQRANRSYRSSCVIRRQTRRLNLTSPRHRDRVRVAAERVRNRRRRRKPNDVASFTGRPLARRANGYRELATG